MKDVSWRLGHKTTKMSENVYLHQLRHDKRAKQVMDRVAAIRFPGIAGSHSDAPPALPPAIEVADTSGVIDLKATTVAELPPPAPAQNSLPEIQKFPAYSLIVTRRARPVVLLALCKMRRCGSMTRSIWSSRVIPSWRLLFACNVANNSEEMVERGRRCQTGNSSAAVRTAELEAKFAELSAQGHQLTDIAYRLGIPITTLKRWRAGRTAGNELRRENEGPKSVLSIRKHR